MTPRPLDAVATLARAAMLGLITALLTAVAASVSKVPSLPKPTPICPDCREATSPYAAVKE